MKHHNCENQLRIAYPGHHPARDGERWTCTCGLVYEHVCSESDGCWWTPLKTPKRSKAVSEGAEK